MSTIDGPKKRMGRPPVDSEPVKVRMERNLLDALDAWCAANPDSAGQAPGRPEAVRQLLASALGL